MSENRSGEIVSAFMIGGLIGAALGILFAPAKGKDTREKLNDWVDDTKEKAKDAGEKINEWVDDAKEKTKDALETVEDEIKKRKEQLLKRN